MPCRRSLCSGPHRWLALWLGVSALACGGEGEPAAGAQDSPGSAAVSAAESWPPPAGSQGATSPGPDAPPVASRDPFVGRFETISEGVIYRLELGTRDGQRYAGVVQVDGAGYPIAGTRSGGELAGRFNDPDGSAYPYRSRPSPNGLTFVLDDEDIVEFARIGSERPPTGFRGAPPPASGGRPAAASPNRPAPAPPPPASPPGNAPGGWPPPPPPPS